MKALKIRDVVLGEGTAKICVPVVGRTTEEVLEQARKIMALKPDIIEWRCDCLDIVTEPELDIILRELRAIAGETPILFTFRTDAEGGNKHISDKEYVNVNLFAAATGNVDLIDVEAYSKGHLATTLIREIHANGAKVIASNHDFYKTPSAAVIESVLITMSKYDPDICKIAVMPKEKSDVQVLIDASASASDKLGIPIISMSMGELGSVTRVCTDKTKSCVTFAAGVESSAPGQIPCGMLREIYELVENLKTDKNIMLIGFMGTGKSTVSETLCRITGLEEIDVDKYIVESQGRTIANIFEDDGEKGFRDIETEALRELQKVKGRIISCGGGAVLRDENVQIMKDGGIILLLTASPEVIFDRVKDNTDRPILNQDMSLNHVKNLMEARRERYEYAADIMIDTNHSDRVKTCYSILKKVNEFLS